MGGLCQQNSESDKRLVPNALHGSVGIVLLSPDRDVFFTRTLLLENVALTLVGIIHGIFL